MRTWPWGSEFLPWLPGRKADDDDRLLPEVKACQARQNQAWTEMNPALRSKYSLVAANRSCPTFVERYELGTVLSEVENDARFNQGQVYGANPLERLHAATNCGNLIDDAIFLAQVFSKEEIQRFDSSLLENGMPLRVRHVRCLANVKDHAKREVLLQLVLQHSLSANELSALCQASECNHAHLLELRRLRKLLPRAFVDLVHHSCGREMSRRRGNTNQGNEPTTSQAYPVSWDLAIDAEIQLQKDFVAVQNRFLATLSKWMDIAERRLPLVRKEQVALSEALHAARCRHAGQDICSGPRGPKRRT